MILADRMLSGRGVPEDLQGAHELLVQADRIGNTTASFMLGEIYEKGRGSIQKNLVAAVLMYRKAGRHESFAALQRIEAEVLQNEEQVRDVEAFVEIGRVFAALDTPEANFRLYGMHMTGKGVIKSEAEALRRLKQAARSGHPAAQLLVIESRMPFEQAKCGHRSLSVNC